MDEAGIARGPVPPRRAAFVRQFRPNDLIPLHVLDQELFGDLAYQPVALRQFTDVHYRHCLVLDADPPLLGYVLAGFAVRSPDAWVLGLGVHPEVRGCGYGRVLMERSLEKLSADGARNVRLTVDPDNGAAIMLYESLGFRKTSFEPHYYGDGEDRYEMMASLVGQYAPGVVSHDDA